MKVKMDESLANLRNYTNKMSTTFQRQRERTINALDMCTDAFEILHKEILTEFCTILKIVMIEPPDFITTCF